MRTVFIERFGSPAVLRYREAPDPVLKPGDVMIRVGAIGVNFADLLMRMGIYPDVSRPPFIPGLEVAGVVEQVEMFHIDPDGNRLQVGDRVLALTNALGGYAERVSVPCSHVVRIPDRLAFEDAAALPVNYLTAYHAIVRIGNMQPGERILVHGAAGGVGIAAIQLAKVRKLVVFGTAGPSKQDDLRRLGVDFPIDHTSENFETAVRKIAHGGIDMVMDPNGGRSLRKSYRCLAPSGRLIVYGIGEAISSNGRRSLPQMVRAMLTTPWFHPLSLMSRNIAVAGMAVGKLMAHGDTFQCAMREILHLHGEGMIRPLIAKAFLLEEASEAHRYIHQRANVGKVILMP